MRPGDFKPLAPEVLGTTLDSDAVVQERIDAALREIDGVELDDGCWFSVTIGVEHFDGYDVGPVHVSVMVRKDELGSEAYRRARRAASFAFEAELLTRRREHVARFGER